MLYFFDNNGVVIDTILKDDIIELSYEEKINTARILYGTFKGTMPNGAFGAGHKTPSERWEEATFLFYRIESSKNHGTHSEFTAIESGFEELERADYIRDRRFYPGWVQEALEAVVDGTQWTVGTNDFERDKFFSNFYFNSRLECLGKIVEKTGGEVQFEIDFNGTEVFGRYLHFKKRIGPDKGRRFAHGSGLLSVERTIDYSDLYTALIGRGSGVALEDEEGNETGGYSRKITFEDVRWAKSSGDPLDKPLGSDLLIDPIATSFYGLANGNRPRVRVAEFDDIEDPILLLDETYKELKKVSKPIVRYKAKIKDTKGVELGETVSIVAKEYDMIYKTRVTKRVVDLLLSDSPQVELEEVEVST
jgi:phage minor structural protein